MQFLYDYAFCRNGIKPVEKKINLFLYFPDINKEIFISNNPNDSSRKSCNWYLVANALFFKNSAFFIR